MFGIFKSKKEKLQQQYAKLMKEAYELSTIDRMKSDAKTAEAEVIAKKIEELNNSTI